MNQTTSSAHKETLAQIAAILATLAETNGSPESMLYIFVGMDMDKWQRMRGILTGGDKPFVTIHGNFVTLTTHGRNVADRINAVISK